MAASTWIIVLCLGIALRAESGVCFWWSSHGWPYMYLQLKDCLHMSMIHSCTTMTRSFICMKGWTIPNGSLENSGSFFDHGILSASSMRKGSRNMDDNLLSLALWWTWTACKLHWQPTKKPTSSQHCECLPPRHVRGTLFETGFAY
jgi:hypothetical protein